MWIMHTLSIVRRNVPIHATCSLYEKAGELILEVSRIAAERLLLDNQEVIIYKNNTDYKGHSYGAHENYLMSRKVPFDTIVDGLIPFLVTRIIITGSGKVERKTQVMPQIIKSLNVLISLSKRSG